MDDPLELIAAGVKRIETNQQVMAADIRRIETSQQGLAADIKRVETNLTADHFCFLLEARAVVAR